MMPQHGGVERVGLRRVQHQRRGMQGVHGVALPPPQPRTQPGEQRPLKPHARQSGRVRLPEVHARADGHAGNTHGNIPFGMIPAVIIGRSAAGKIARNITAQLLRPFKSRQTQHMPYAVPDNRHVFFLLVWRKYRPGFRHGHARYRLGTGKKQTREGLT